MQLLSNIEIKVNENIYLKDPESSELGRKIIGESHIMIHEDGFEHFTFRKLAARINSTEASVYRYFESKHKLLLYLITWYWAWMEYLLVFSLANIESPEKRLENAIDLLTGYVKSALGQSHIDANRLNAIVIAESSKAYLTKDVDKVNAEGVFLGYKRLVARVSDIILEINPDYKYPHMLVSTMIEGAHHQRFFAEHLPRLTDQVSGEDSVRRFYKDLIFKAIQK